MMHHNYSLLDMQGEIWEDIIGYEGYYKVSNFMRVKSVQRTIPHPTSKTFTIRERILKAHLNCKGYLKVPLTKDTVFKLKSVHRLVAEAFILNPENLPEVNHKNGIKTDNRIENLEWVSSSDNQKHSYKNGLRKPVSFIGGANPTARKVVQLSKNDEYINEFPCIREAASSLNQKYYSTIGKACRGTLNTAHGYKWMYFEHYQERLQVLSI